MGLINRFTLVFLLIIGFSSCSDNENDGPSSGKDESYIPSQFLLDIPDLISDNSQVNESDPADVRVYQGIKSFIKTAENDALTVQNVIQSIRSNHLNLEKEFAVISESDGQTKYANISNDVTKNGKTYDYELLVKDKDNNLALQVLWDEKPFDGVAIFSPYHLDNTDTSKIGVFYRVDYAEQKNGFDKKMLVQTSYPTSQISNRPYNRLKMLVTEGNNVISVSGNGNLPFYELSNGSQGVQQVVTGKTSDGFATMQVWYASPTSEDYESANALPSDKTPGYISNDGLIGVGENKPVNLPQELFSLSTLKAYQPSQVADLTIDFIEE